MEKIKLYNMCKVINPKTGEVLVQERVKNWQGIAFPGGKIEEGEDVVSSVKREVYEETGLELKTIHICGIKDWYDKKEKVRSLVVLFVSNDYEGTLIEETNEGKVYWVKEDKLNKMSLATDFDKLLEVFNNRDINEMVYFDNESDDEENRWELKLL